MTSYIAKGIARNLRRPEGGLFGFVTKKILTKRNRVVEEKAVNLSRIKPDHKVLEIGFGPGIGLRDAYMLIKDGQGSVSGIDFSEEMVKQSEELFKSEVATGKIHLTLGSVDKMPYKSNTFDRVFHTNCFYFWPDMNHAVQEIHRVMATDSLMVATMCIDALQELKSYGFMQYANFDPSRYIHALESNHFENVRLEEMCENGYKYQVIYAHVSNKGEQGKCSSPSNGDRM